MLIQKFSTNTIFTTFKHVKYLDLFMNLFDVIALLLP